VAAEVRILKAETLRHSVSLLLAGAYLRAESEAQEVEAQGPEGQEHQVRVMLGGVEILLREEEAVEGQENPVTIPLAPMLARAAMDLRFSTMVHIRFLVPAVVVAVAPALPEVDQALEAEDSGQSPKVGELEAAELLILGAAVVEPDSGIEQLVDPAGGQEL
jgi:hypothetical protein